MKDSMGQWEELAGVNENKYLS
ncbi:protein of unknown function [Pseudomonas sp. JV241A]|nr:protein of unknown function [Pseudomonas sp. JV241A]